MERSIFQPEHDVLRDTIRRWLSNEVVPELPEWESHGIVPRDLFARAGELGFLAFDVPEAYGGAGISDFRNNAILAEEVQHAGATGAGLGLTLHNDVCLPYFLKYCTDEQRERWLPGIASGELITAVAMTEPSMGSDLASMKTMAARIGDDYILNGSKTFITNGINADLVITAVKTDSSQRHGGMSLIVLERGIKGFERGRNLKKLGNHAQDTAELFFTNVHVPAENLLGEEGKGFAHLVDNLSQERLSIAVASVAAARTALDWTIEYVTQRQAFGQPIGDFQNTRFVLAEVATEVDVSQSFTDACIVALNSDRLTGEDAAKAKWWCTEVQKRSIDRCLQLFGGYGYMLEYPIARAYADARITTIYGGTTEIMKEIIGRSLISSQRM